MHYRNFITMIRLPSLCGLLCGMLALPLLGEVTADAPKRPNVLFIAIDDLRPQLGCYGHDEIHSPQIDKLAAQGSVFERAYANSPVCGASRLSVLTGIRAHPNQWKTDDMSEKFTSLPAHFKNHGYHAVSIGKVFHHMHDREADWSVPPWRSAAIYHGEKDWAGYNHYGIWQNPESANHISAKKRGPYRESAEVEDDAYQDGKVADQTIAELKRLKQQDKPFFLATGFWRPHLPFNAPKKYWDLYQRENIALAPNRNKPENLPRLAIESNEFDGYALTGNRKETDEFHREARHAYYACGPARFGWGTGKESASRGNSLSMISAAILEKRTISHPNIPRFLRN
jgi:arylsulfatase A-like enzyme